MDIPRVLLLAVWIVIPSRFAPAQPGAAGFLSLPDPQKLQVVAAALDQRQARLDRIDYRLHESTTTTDRDSSRQTYSSNLECRFAQDGPLQRIETRNLAPKPDAREEAVSIWDGRRLRSLTRFTDRHRLAGVVQDTLPAEIDRQWYHQMLGLRVPGVMKVRDGRVVQPMMPLAEWLRDAAADPGYSLSFHQSGTDPAAIDIIVRGNSVTWTYTLDPPRGWMPVRYHKAYRHGSSAADFTNEVVDAREVNGLWLPTAVKTRSTSSAHSLQGDWEYRVQDIKTGDDVAVDFTLDWPADTLVTDLLARVGYIVNADGTSTMVPFRDVQTGQTFRPRAPQDAVQAGVQATLTSSIQPRPAAATVAPAAEPPHDPAPAARAGSIGLGRRVPAAILAAVLLLTGSAVAVASRRGRTHTSPPVRMESET